jgi:hypothetical protein
MLGIDSRYRLKEFLRAVAEKELLIESERQRLAAMADFEPYAAFCRVDRDQNKRITASEIRDFLM